MKKLFYFSALLLQSAFSFCQTDSVSGLKWKHVILNDYKLNVTERISDILQYDLTDLIKTEVSDQPIGYIGNNYQHFEIFFTSVKKTEGNGEYYVTGKNRVMSNICDFKGTITFTNARFYEHKSDYGNYPDSLKLGVLVGNYKFEENPQQKHVGKLEGYVAVRFYISAGKIFIDDWNVKDEKYYNNQYVGTWTSYDGKTSDPCNWGNYRVPSCGDLDVGKKDFYPNDKYKSNGWDNYPSLLNTIWWK